MLTETHSPLATPDSKPDVLPGTLLQQEALSLAGRRELAQEYLEPWFRADGNLSEPEPTRFTLLPRSACNEDSEGGVAGLADRIAAGGIPDEDIPRRAGYLGAVAQALNPTAPNARSMFGLEGILQKETDAELLLELARGWNADVLAHAPDARLRSRRAVAFPGIARRLWYGSYDGSNIESNETKAGIVTSLERTYNVTYAFEDKHADDAERAALGGKCRQGALDLSIEWQDGRQAEYMTRIFEAVADKKPAVAEKMLFIATYYGKNHGLDESVALGIVRNVLPRLEAHDPAVGPLEEPFTTFGYNYLKDGEKFGIGDFVVHSFTRAVTPANIQELVRILHDIPTSNQARFETNRLDGISLARAFIDLRNCIHGQKPGTHDVIKAMLDYKASGNPKTLNAAIDTVPTLHASRARLLDLSKYDKKGSNPDLPEHMQEPIMTILERLERNTRPLDEEPPEVSDDTLSSLLKSAYGAKPASRRNAIIEVTRYMNDVLAGMMESRQVGIEPSVVQAIAWLEQRQFGLLQGMTFEDQVGLAKQSWFKEVLQSHELTHNNAYDAGEFEKFWNGLQGLSDRSAFRRISERAIGQVRDLSATYMVRGKKHWSDALWSGNTTGELVGLSDPREAATAVGRRLLAEYQRQLS